MLREVSVPHRSLIKYLETWVRLYQEGCRRIGSLRPLNNPFHIRQPAQAAVGKLLHLGRKFGLLEPEVINGADPKNRAVGSSRGDTVHESAAG